MYVVGEVVKIIRTMMIMIGGIVVPLIIEIRVIMIVIVLKQLVMIIILMII